LYNLRSVRILLLNLYYPPDTSATARMAAIVAEALAGRHDVTVLCGRPSYDPTERHPWYLFRRETLGRITILRVGSTAYARTRMRQRVINYLTYAALSVVRALFVKTDIVLGMTDPPFEGIVAAFVALLKRRPFFYNIRDMYPDMAVAGKLIHPGALARFWESLHRWALRRARRVIVLGEDMRDALIPKGVDAARIAIVRDGVENPSAPLPPPDADVVAAIRNGFRFVLVHAGNLGFSGAWEALVRAAREVEAEGLGLVFVGDGAQRGQVQALAEGTKNVRMLPFFPPSKIPSVLAAADAHVITVIRGLEGVVVPSKLYGVLAAGRPVLAVTPQESDVARIALRHGCGLAADPGDPAAIARTMRALASDPDQIRHMGERARAAAPEYDRVLHLQKFLKVLEEAGQS
jgi:colanic acid biosynthesis glycosyl transferase WcaI